MSYAFKNGGVVAVETDFKFVKFGSPTLLVTVELIKNGEVISCDPHYHSGSDNVHQTPVLKFSKSSGGSEYFHPQNFLPPMRGLTSLQPNFQTSTWSALISKGLDPQTLQIVATKCELTAHLCFSSLSVPSTVVLERTKVVLKSTLLHF